MVAYVLVTTEYGLASSAEPSRPQTVVRSTLRRSAPSSNASSG